MFAPTAKTATQRLPYLALAEAFGRSWWSRHPLPPGDFVALDRLERANRRLLIERAADFGPIFKGLMENRLAVCVVGHGLGRRLLKEHSASLRPVAIQLEPLVPKGFMRQMGGDCHHRYRRALVHGVNAVDFDMVEPLLERIVSEALVDYAGRGPHEERPHAWADTLSVIASGMLVHVFFGERPGTATFDGLMAGYRRLGPHGVVWHLSTRQLEAFDDLRRQVAGLLHSDRGPAAGALLAAMASQGSLDATMIGNLIYMVELGRYDLRGLLRWISKYAGEHGTWLERIASEAVTPVRGSRSAAEAFVLETLRMDQSERLMRNVLRDIVFEGYLIPKGAMLRVCMWEAHKDADAFPQPFEFDPSRFLDDAPAGERFSPFGLDHHLCPLASMSVQLATAFLRVLARCYTISTCDGDRAVRGPYHWSPAPGFAATLTAREGRAT